MAMASESVRDRVHRRAREKEEEHKSSRGYISLPKDVEYFEVEKKSKRDTSVKVDIDILAYVVSQFNPEQEKGKVWYERTFFVHGGIGADNKTVLCLKSFKKKCPICEKVVELKEDWTTNKKLIRQLKPRERQIFNVDTPEGIKILESSYHTFGKYVDKEINENKSEHPEFADFFGLEGGSTLKVRFDENKMVPDDGGEPIKFLEVGRIDFEPRGAYDEAVLKDVVDLDTCLVELTYATLNRMFLEIEDDDASGAQPEGPITGTGTAFAPSTTAGADIRRSKYQKGAVAAPSPAPNPGPDTNKRQVVRRNNPAGSAGTESTQEQPDGELVCPGVDNKGQAGRYIVDCDKLNFCRDCEIWDLCRDGADKMEASKGRGKK